MRIVVIAYGEEPVLAECVGALIDQLRPRDELVIVDNGAAEAIARLPLDVRRRVIAAGRNLGFAAGCNLGARDAQADVLAFVNSDAVVAPGAIEAMRMAVSPGHADLVCGSLRLADDPSRVNSVGNPVHYLGLSWCGGYGDQAQRHNEPRQVAAASGAFFGISRSAWGQLGGFETRFFMYHEDADLSLRAWLLGLKVRYEPRIVAVHHYDYSRNAGKMYLVQRNRWIMVLSVYPLAVLLAALPALILCEIPMTLLAWISGWGTSQLRAMMWVARNSFWIGERRRQIQRSRQLKADEFARLLSADLNPAMIAAPPGLRILDGLTRGYWALARRAIVGGPRGA